MRCNLTVPWIFSVEAELEAVLKKTDGDRAEYERKLERQARLLDARAAKIRKLEGLLLTRGGGGVFGRRSVMWTAATKEVLRLL